MKKNATQTLSKQIVEYVKELLLSGELAAGGKLTELSLAKALSIIPLVQGHRAFQTQSPEKLRAA